MKTFLNSISNKLKAVYIVWVFINIVLLTFGLSSKVHRFSFGIGEKAAKFFPFQWDKNLPIWKQGDVAYYDFTEFLFYVFTPLILAYSIWLFRKK